MSERDDIIGRLDGFTEIQRELEHILQTLVLNDSTILDALAQMFGVIQKISARSEQVLESQTRTADEIRSLFAALAAIQPASSANVPIVVRTDHSAAENPEFALLQFLSAFLDERTVVDVGAHIGDFSERLLVSGMQVYAFEPFPPSFAALEARLGSRDSFTAAPFAIGAADYDGRLHVACDVTESNNGSASLFNSLVDHPLGTSFAFAEDLPVRVRSLASLQESGQIPSRTGLLKIDTEGNDLDVILGMGDFDSAIVMAEYWDAEHAFGRGGHGHLGPIVDAMRPRGFVWYVVVYHLDEDGIISYYFNRPHAVPKSWGNAIFFRDRALFAQAARWCEATLRLTVHR